MKRTERRKGQAARERETRKIQGEKGRERRTSDD